MKPSENAAWLKLGIDAWALGWQAARVMGLRTAKMAEGGPAAGMEAWLMLSEKIQTAVEVQEQLVDLIAQPRGLGQGVLALGHEQFQHRRVVLGDDGR